MDTLIHITQFTDEWKMHDTHKEYILEYAHDVFDVSEKDFVFLRDDLGYTHMLISKNNPSLKELSEDIIDRKCNWIDGFVWGLSYAQLKRKKKNSESQSSECKGTENNE